MMTEKEALEKLDDMVEQLREMTKGLGGIEHKARNDQWTKHTVYTRLGIAETVLWGARSALWAAMETEARDAD